MENQKKVWQTKEFSEAKSKFRLDKKCSQCGSTKGLTPHHTISFKSLESLKLREIAIRELCREKEATFYPSALTKEGGFSSSKGYVKSIELREFIRSHPEFRSKALESAKKEYYSFSDIETLCKRCHFAIEKRMRLCPICREKYHGLKFNSCFGCKEEYERRYKEFEKEINDAEEEISNYLKTDL